MSSLVRISNENVYLKETAIVSFSNLVFRQDIYIFKHPYEYLSFPILLFVNNFTAFQCLGLIQVGEIFQVLIICIAQPPK